MTLWTLALVLGVVVTAVVAALLALILREARRIEAVAADIWEVGQRIANNTVHVPDLSRSNLFLGRVLAQAPELHGHLERIRGHAETCPGCPRCALGETAFGETP
jgi:hypothetical protein